MNQKGRDLKPRAFDRFATRVSLNMLLVPVFKKIRRFFNDCCMEPKYRNIIIIYKKSEIVKK
jgi:hypothetical protein